jgi:hypothetical protein
LDPKAARNLNPHKAAVAAMFLYGRRYSEGRGGSMDFWDSLRKSDQRVCRDLVAKVEAAPSE